MHSRDLSYRMSADSLSSQYVIKYGSDRGVHCLPRPTHHTFSLKRLGFSDTEEAECRNGRL